MSSELQRIQEAVGLHRAGRLAEAESLYGKALAADGKCYPALHLMGLLRLHQGRAAEALSYIERALALRPGAPEVLANYGVALDAVGRHTEALRAVDALVKLDADNSRAWSLRGALLARLHRHEDALADLDRALALDSLNQEAWSNRGLILMALLRPQPALASYDRALELEPGDAQARNNRGLALKALGRAAEAIAEFDRVLREKPDHAGAWVNRASVLWSMDALDRALESYDRALSIQPDMAEALASRANCLWTRKGDLSGAIADLERLIAVRPDYPYARGSLFHLRMHAGEWQHLAQERAALDHAVRRGERVVEPYVYQGVSSSPADLLASARIYTQDKFPPAPVAAPATAPLSQARRIREGRIRLGYLCGEFRAQATMYLAAGLFEHHDRTRFEVMAFDNSREDGSAMRRRVTAAFDKLVSIQGVSDGQVVQVIAAEEIDILVNLNGYFGTHRMDVFARRPARLQVNYLGFPGSLGAPYIDYILADAEVIPAGDEQHYSERVVRLPGCYQINDDRRPRPAPGSRAAHGLRETHFVFCHFNSSYKVTPEMFALWLRLLAAVPASVLWILESNARFAANLRRQATLAGVDPTRLVFAAPMDHAAHLSRLTLGDLFLDSLPCNAHTTASDALWAGLPLITCRGKAFAGRVAASLLRAAGLAELIADDLQTYESLALKLAADRALLESYRERLTRDPARLPLFDTARTTRQIEAAYEQMMARSRRGLVPAGFAVPG